MARRKKKKKEEAELDITPMIDVTFLLLIFFMVTSTMQATPDRDIPPSKSGQNVVKSEDVKEVAVSMPRAGGDEGEYQWEGKDVTLDQLKAEMIQASTGNLSILIYADREVPSGVVGEVETLINEVAKETETEIGMNFAVKGD